MLPKGILFDLDDTIIAFDAVSTPVWKRICEEYADRRGLPDSAQVYEAIDQARRWYWSDRERHRTGRLNLSEARRKVVRLALERLGLDDPPLAHEISDVYSARSEEAMQFLPKAEETLQHLTDRGVSLALMTNGEAPKQRGKIRRFGLEKFFKTILIEGELGFGKPDPAVYHRALKDLQLRPTEVWAVGDNLEWDVAGPQKLGIFGIWHDYKRKGLPASSDMVPDRIINSISELLDGAPG